MQHLGLILFVFAFVCFVIAIWQQNMWNKLVAAGLAFATAATIFGGAASLFH
jgi:hypothetical protein